MSFTDRLMNSVRGAGQVGIIGGAVLLAVVVLGVYLLINQASAGAIGREVSDEGAGHVTEGQPLTYRNSPPASGQHYPSPRPWGVYQEEVPEGYWVHNLEHGGIVLLYNCPEACPELQQQVEDAFKTFPVGKYGQVKLLVTPYAKLQNTVTAVAWNRILELDTYDREQVLQFYKAYVDRGPEDVP